jgi:hypothetical protein
MAARFGSVNVADTVMLVFCGAEAGMLFDSARLVTFWMVMALLIVVELFEQMIVPERFCSTALAVYAPFGKAWVSIGLLVTALVDWMFWLNTVTLEELISENVTFGLVPLTHSEPSLTPESCMVMVPATVAPLAGLVRAASAEAATTNVRPAAVASAARAAVILRTMGLPSRVVTAVFT